MKVAFDIGHPAQAHLFRNAITELNDRGAKVTVLSREKEITTALLDAYGIDHTPLSTNQGRLSGFPGLAVEWSQRSIRVVRALRAADPDVVVSHVNPPAVYASRLVGATSIVFTDVEVTPLVSNVTYPIADIICTPENFGHDIGSNQVRYNGFHELAYLHPDRFEPDPARLVKHGVDVDQPYSVLRFVGWDAYHDVGQAGISLSTKRELIERLREHGPVYITSEADLPADLQQYQLPVPPHLAHDLLAQANLYVGDSQAMAAESAVLGTPALRLNTFVGDDDMSKFVELEEEYGLLFSIEDEHELVDRAEALTTEDRAAWRSKRDALIAEKIDVTGFMLEQINEAAGERRQKVVA
jgi:predicted glycosyltransferase